MKPVSESEKSAALRWFGNQPRPIQLEAIKLQTDLLRQQREKGERINPLLALDCLADASRKMRHTEESLAIKEKLTSAEAKTISERKLQRFKASRKKGKPSPKREAIRLKFLPMIQTLRKEENFGWRNCATYLKQHYNFEISHSHLQKIVEDLEQLERTCDTEKT